MTGKIVLGFSSFVGEGAVLYRDKGWYEDTLEELNVRKVEDFEELDQMDWDNAVVKKITEKKPYGCRWGGGISALWEVTEEEIDALRKENQRIKEELKAKEQATKSGEVAKRQAAFDEARRTGKKVALSMQMIGCSDPGEQCSADVVYEWAMPDGTSKTTRQHTW